jgi:hypothetical protein
MVRYVGGASGEVAGVEKRTGIHQKKSEGYGYEERSQNVTSSISPIPRTGSTKGM